MKFIRVTILVRGGPMVSGTSKDAELLREQARLYRERAAREDDPDRAALLLELAEALDREAAALEKRGD
jgi:hypothetical protein